MNSVCTHSWRIVYNSAVTYIMYVVVLVIRLMYTYISTIEILNCVSFHFISKFFDFYLIFSFW